MLSVQRIDHTADVGLIITADTCENLFKAAAEEMFALICKNNSAIQEAEEITLSVEGEDFEELLVNWLSELNFLFQTEQLLLAQVISLKIDGNSLSAKYTAERISAKKHHITTEIKAVTYHNLYVRQENNIWKTEIIFDV